MDVSLLDWHRFMASDARAEARGESSWAALDGDDCFVDPAAVGVTLDAREGPAVEASALYGALRDALPGATRRAADEPFAALFWDHREDSDAEVPFRPSGRYGEQWRLGEKWFDCPFREGRNSRGGEMTVGRESHVGPLGVEHFAELWDEVDPAELEAAADDALAADDWAGEFRSAAALTDYLCGWGELLAAAADRRWGVWIMD